MKFNFDKNILLLLIMLLVGNVAWSQTESARNSAQRFVTENAEKWNLKMSDVTDLVVSDMYTSEHNGLTHVYFNQRHNGVEIYNAITSVHIAKDGKVYNTGHRFVADVAAKANTNSARINAKDAVAEGLRHLEIPLNESLLVKSSRNGQEFVIDKGTFSHSDVKVKLCYTLTVDGKLNLAWNMAVEQLDRKDYWSMRVDAITGEILNKNNWTTHCKFDDNPYHNHDAHCRVVEHEDDHECGEVTIPSNARMMGATYNVFGESIDGVNSPFESPIHGDRTLMTDPHSTVASPFGWHDTDGEEGPEYTITRGNNTHSYLDLSNNNSSDGSPDGGADLLFDYPYDANAEPSQQQDAAVTNLFYMTNTMHDYAYHFGFTEDAGAFQQNNYGNHPSGSGDPVLAEAQDGGGEDNANFSTPPDGSNGVMQMYVWNRVGGKLLTALEPASVAGTYETGTASYGPEVSETAIVGEVALVDDGTVDGTLGCEEIVNTDEVAGKVALIDRGICFFEEKTINAQNAGAIAVIICNFEDSTFGLGDSPEVFDITIPSIGISFSDCQLLRAQIDNGLTVSIGLPSQSGPDQYDGDFDNGIIAHEYGHGISNRLTGGPIASGCLGVAEQMGEGWSDFFTLVTGVKPGDTGEMRKGIGTYVNRQETTGSGIRRFPYSTDMNINPLTYDDIITNPEVHALGEVWTAMTWDLYWALVDEYGFDLDYTNMEAGNNIAVQLVMDGMKIQQCNPGFVDGRNAILLADVANNGGVNECLIWEVFARRGLGFYAEQGFSTSATDNKEDFEPLPSCVKELKINKTATEFISAGDEIEYTLTIINHKGEVAPGVVVTDEIPAGCTYVAGSASNGGTVNNGIISWEIGDMESGDDSEMVLTYSVLSDVANPSINQFYDDLEDGDGNWASYTLDPDFQSGWGLADLYANSGENAFAILDGETESDQALQLFVPVMVSGNQPTLRFFHFFDTEASADAGFLEFSYDNVIWNAVDGDAFFKNGYTSGIQYGTFTVPFLEGFSGNSEGFVGSYVDLSEFAGEEIFLRWRFGTDDNTGGLGWFVDDVQLLDLISYNSEACITSDAGDMACVQLEGKGTLVEPELNVSTAEVLDENVQLMVHPNPANDILNVSIQSVRTENVTLSIYSVDGREVLNKALTTTNGVQTLSLNVSDIASGFYFVRIATSKGIAIQKVVID